MKKALVGSKYFSWQQISVLMESALETLIIRITSRLRQSELPEIGAINASEVYSKMLNAQRITEMAVRSVDLFQAIITTSLGWLYIFHLSALTGIIFLLLGIVEVLGCETLQHLTTPVMQAEDRKDAELFATFNHILHGFKEIKLNQQKNEDLFERHLVPLTRSMQNIRIRMVHYLNDYYHFVNFCFYILFGFCGFVVSSWYPPDVTLMVLGVSFYLWLSVILAISYVPALIQGKVVMQDLYHLLRSDAVARDSLEVSVHSPS